MIPSNCGEHPDLEVYPLRSQTPEENLEAIERTRVIAMLLDSLTELERRVIVMRFGLWDGDDHTLDEVGRALGVTRERVRVVESKGLRKLRHPARNNLLREAMGLPLPARDPGPAPETAHRPVPRSFIARSEGLRAEDIRAIAAFLFAPDGTQCPACQCSKPFGHLENCRLNPYLLAPAFAPTVR